MMRGVSGDARRILVAQALRAAVYGFGAVLLGATLEQSGYSSTEAGLVLGAVLTGTVIASLAIARSGDRWGRRRCYVVLYLALGAVGVAFALSNNLWLLVVAALTGALSTEVVESGPFTSLEQAMLATDLDGRERIRGFGVYNAVASAAGSLGALAAAVPGVLRDAWSGAPTAQRYFLVFVPVALAGAAVARRLSPRVEAAPAHASADQPGLRRSRSTVQRLAGLFAIDSFGGGFVVQSFLAYWFSVHYGASVATLGVVFFGVGLLQTASFLVAVRLATRFGLLRTMVFTHLPSNVLLALIPFAPSLGVAIALLLARTGLSQMDVPTRQAYVMALVDPGERTAAAAYTNTARYVARPIGPVLAGVTQSVALGLPFVLAGGIKTVYDLVLWRWFSHVDLPVDAPARPTRRSVPSVATPTEEAL